MGQRLPPLSTLRLFEAAGRHQSFKLAAAELNVTPGAVSHGIAVLERWLGRPLFDRTPRGLTLTPAGRDFLPYVSEGLDLIAAGTRRMPSPGADSTILVSAAPTFARNLLIPRLAHFRARCPGAAVRVDTQHRQVSFAAEGIDFAIRMARAPLPGLRSTMLLSERLVPVCSPDYRDSLPPGDLAGRLAAATLLQIYTASEDWADWAERSGIPVELPQATLRFDTIQIAFDAAAAGLGVAMGRLPLVEAELAAGRLVTLGPPVPAATGYWLVGHPGVGLRSDLVSFERWLVDEMRHVYPGPDERLSPGRA